MIRRIAFTLLVCFAFLAAAPGHALEQPAVNLGFTSFLDGGPSIGLGLLWHISPDDHLFFNAYFETEARLRPEGERFVLRYVHHF